MPARTKTTPFATAAPTQNLPETNQHQRAYNKFIQARPVGPGHQEVVHRLAQVEAAHRHELNRAHDAAQHATRQMQFYGGETYLVQRAGAVRAAKDAAQVQEAKARQARAEMLLDQRTAELKELNREAADEELASYVAEQVLTDELRTTEASRERMRDLLAERSQHGGLSKDEVRELREQVQSTSSLLLEQQSQIQILRAEATRQQKRAMRLQLERSTEASAQRAAARTAAAKKLAEVELECERLQERCNGAEARALAAERAAEADRKAATEGLTIARGEYLTELQAMEISNRALRVLFERLSNEKHTLISLGSSMTPLSKYIIDQRRRIEQSVKKESRMAGAFARAEMNSKSK